MKQLYIEPKINIEKVLIPEMIADLSGNWQNNWTSSEDEKW